MRFSTAAFNSLGQLIRKDSLAGGAWRVFALFALSQPLFLALFWDKLPPQVPLFFSRPWGESQLTSTNLLLLLPGVTLAVGGVNLAASRFLSQEPVTARIVSWTATVFAILASIALVKIVLLIT